jgi:hypothetical protein
MPFVRYRVFLPLYLTNYFYFVPGDVVIDGDHTTLNWYNLLQTLQGSANIVLCSIAAMHMSG